MPTYYAHVKQTKYTKELLQEAVSKSSSWATLLTYLGRKQSGGMHRLITAWVKHYSIDTSHFTGQGWNKGLNKNTSQSVLSGSIKITIPDEKVFCKDSTYASSKLYKRLLKLGYKDECSTCHISSWTGRKLRLHVDHINGEHSDNRLDNLRLLCPNCHSLTETFGSRKGTWRKGRLAAFRTLCPQDVRVQIPPCP